MTANAETIAIRPMTAEDVEWAQRLAEGAPPAPHWPVGAYAAAIDPEATRRRIALVAETPKEVQHLGKIAPKVGFIIASLVWPGAELESIVVAPAMRRQGVGRALFRALAHELSSSSVTEVTLEVRASNRAALELYRRLSFVEAGRRSRYYVDPVEDAVLMRLELR